MGPNKLYFDHQLAGLRAASSGPLGRLCFEITAASTAGQDGRIQRSLGATAAPGWERLAAVPLEARPSEPEWTEHRRLVARS
jgi:hypothetical protein